jgi:hypothetical protein
MNENKKIARTAGLLYLAFIIIQSFSMLYVDSGIYVPGDAASTINNLLAHEWLFRAGFVCWLAGLVVFLLLANVLYRLFTPVDSHLARLMVIFVIVGVSVDFLNRLNQFVPLMLLSSADNPSARPESNRKQLK